jgi:hypothetical protein
MNRKSLRKGVLAGVVAAAFAVFAPAPAGAESMADWPDGFCVEGKLCYYEEIWGSGAEGRWDPSKGRIGLNNTPWQNRVKSFVSYTTGYFLDAGTRSCRRFEPGHYRGRYDIDFGSKVDSISTTCPY